MNRIHHALLAGSLAAALAVPVAAQSAQSGQSGQREGLRMSDTYVFLKAVRERDGAEAERILSNPASGAIHTRDPSTGEGALHILVRERDLTWLSFMLGRGARPNQQASDGTTPLGLAAQIGWVEGAEQLIARGAAVDMPNNRGETPLILAVHGRHDELVRLLLTQGADADRQDSAAGYSALDYARRDTRNPNLLRLIESAPRRQRQQVVGPTR
jgi:uncharacterized protein